MFNVPGGASRRVGVGFGRRRRKEHTLNVFKRTAAGALLTTVLATAAVAQSAAIDGVVDKINSATITLKHGPAPSLGFKEGVTMMYQVKDPAMIKDLKAGDKVKFEAEDDDAGFVVSKIQKSK
jgi:Cu/Ag efflux protein CusF